MKWIDLGNPRPRVEPTPYQPITWESLAETPLPTLINAPEHRDSFIAVALRRRTRRTFAALSLDQLGALMTLTCRTQRVASSDLGFPLSQTPCPSAGAIHPIHVLLIRPDDERCYRYDPYQHALHNIPCRLDVRQVMDSMQDVLPAPAATLLLFVAEPGMTASKYEAAESLIWRDAGVQLGLFAMASEALGISFCPLGVTGEPWVGQLIDQPGLAGVGAAFVGSRPS